MVRRMPRSSLRPAAIRSHTGGTCAVAAARQRRAGRAGMRRSSDGAASPNRNLLAGGGVKGPRNRESRLRAMSLHELRVLLDDVPDTLEIVLRGPLHEGHNL